MRILTITNLYPNPYQPLRAPFNREQIRSLAQQHDVRVIAPILWTDEMRLRQGQRRLPLSRQVICDGLVVDHPLYIFPPKMLRRFYGFCFKRSIRSTFHRALKEFRPDLVFSSWVYPDGWAAVQLGSEAGLPVVVKLHGSDILRLENHPRQLLPTIETLRRANGVVAVCQDLAQRVIGYGADRQRVFVVYNGIDTRIFHPGPRDVARSRLGLPPHDPIVLFVGNLLPIKGAHVLVNACAILAKSPIPFRCLVVGQGPMRSELERQVARLGLETRVKLVGAVDQNQLADWYRAANVVAIPSFSEGVPNVLLEAAACGIPVVASRVGGIPEVSGLYQCRLVPPGQAESLAQAIAGFLEDSGANPLRPLGPLRSHAGAAQELAGFFEQILRDQARPENGRPGRQNSVQHQPATA